MIEVLYTEDTSLAGYPLERIRKVFKLFKAAEKRACALAFTNVPRLTEHQLEAARGDVEFYAHRLTNIRRGITKAKNALTCAIEYHGPNFSKRAAYEKAVRCAEVPLGELTEHLVAAKARLAEVESDATQIEVLSLSWELPNGRKGRVTQRLPVAT